MGLRTRKDPDVNDSFLWRICHALDEPPRMLAKNIGVEYKELLPLLQGQRGALAEVDRDEVWWKISEYVSRKTGMLLAIREELNRALQADRVKRVSRIQRFKKLHEER